MDFVRAIQLSLAYPIWKSCAQKLSNLLKAQTAKGNSIIETKDVSTFMLWSSKQAH